MLVWSTGTSQRSPRAATEGAEDCLALPQTLGHPDGHAVVMKGVVTAGALGKTLVRIHVVEADGTVAVLLRNISSPLASLQVLHRLCPEKDRHTSYNEPEQIQVSQPASQNPGLLPFLMGSEECLNLKLLELPRCEANVVLRNSKDAQHYEEDVQAAWALVAGAGLQASCC